MANYETLKSAIQQVVKTNGNNEITGALLQQSLLAIIDSLGAGYQYVGIATPNTNPGQPDQKVFYIASTAGIYSNFDSIVVNDGEIAILRFDNVWQKDITGIEKVHISQNTQTGKTYIQIGDDAIIEVANGIIADDVNSIIDIFLSNNRCNPNDVLVGKGIDASGNIVDVSDRSLTGFIEVVAPYIFFAKNGVNIAANRIAVYDANKNFITRISSQNSGYLLDEQYKYVRIQFDSNSLDNILFVGFSSDGITPVYDEYSRVVKIKYSALPNSVASIGDVELAKSYSDNQLMAFANTILDTQESHNLVNPSEIMYDTGIDSTGNIVTSSGTCLTGLIEVSNDYVFFGTNGASANVQRLALYDENGGFLERRSSVASKTYIDRSIYKYIRAQFRPSDEDTIYYVSFYPSATSTPVYDEYGGKQYIKPSLLPTNENPFYGLNAVAFGTSLTERADRDSEFGNVTTFGYLTELRSLSGMTIDNQAQGGATILSDNVLKSIYSQIMNYTSYQNKQVCIIEGFVNDWYKDDENTLGQYTDNTTSSVCGRLRLAIEHIFSENPRITIFVILDHYGKNAGGLDFSSSAILNGKTQYEYYQELLKVCESMGVICIKEYATSEISEHTPQYLTDYIHCNEIGAKQSGTTIWNLMKRFSPNK